MSARRPYADLSTDALRRWLANHRACIEAGVNVGQIDRDKAQEFSLELIRREGSA